MSFQLETPIKPRHIKADRGLMGAFGNYEAEQLAAVIIQFCQTKDEWQPVPVHEIRSRLGDSTLGRAIQVLIHKLGYLRLSDDGYVMTVRFVAKCYAASPASS